MRFPVVPIKELRSGLQQGFHSREAFAMGDFPAEMTPQHLDRVEPGARGWQGEQDKLSCSPSHHCLQMSDRGLRGTGQHVRG